MAMAGKVLMPYTGTGEGGTMTAAAALREDGFLFVKRGIDGEQCEGVAAAITRELGERIEKEGYEFQEEPSSFFSVETRALMRVMQEKVISLLRVLLKPERICVPECWEDTLYGRYKRKNCFTIYHCDALNTIFQRRLLEKMELQEEEEGEDEEDGKEVIEKVELKSKKKRFRESEAQNFLETGALRDGADPILELPIFTYWICLRPITDPRQSHLRLHPRSHKLPFIRAKQGKFAAAKTNLYAGESSYSKVEPESYRYKPGLFQGPAFPEGYAVGDIVLFHCLIQHEASVHKMPQTKGKSQVRVSMDGRIFMKL